jgi:ribosomal protein S18 acetylase RimI-like enzyme
MSNPAPLFVRPARVEEAATLSAIARAAKARWAYPPAWLDAWESELTFTPATFDRMAVFVAERGGAPLGVAALERRAPGEWSIEHLWVAPAAEGQGVGRALFAELVHAAREQGGGVLEILSDPHAAGFYERMGAHPTGSVAAAMPGDPDRALPRFEYRVE